MKFIKNLDIRKSHRYAQYICKCGNKTIARVSHVKSGAIKTCGCSKRPHGGSGTPAWQSWRGMLERVSTSKYYTHIEICTEWYDYKNFKADMGERPKGYTIDRIDNTKGYYKENCRWATWKTQNYNKRNTVRIETPKGSKTLKDISLELGYSLKCIRSRYERGDRYPRICRKIERKITK